MNRLLTRNLRGRHHVQRNLPCQDRFLARTGAEGTVLAVCDGHGGAPYTRSGLGARILARCAAGLLSAGLPGEEAAAALKDRYDRLVNRHLALRPLKDWERSRLGRRPDQEAYGTTFVCAVLTGEGTDVFQLGDGGVFLLGRDGRFLPPLPPDPDCVANVTSSMAYPREECLRHFRFHRYPPAAAAFVFTDGWAFSGPLPWEAAALLLEPERAEEALDELLLQGDHGDDQTFLCAYDPEQIAEPAFRAGVEAEAELGKEALRRAAMEAQMHQLACYLKLAMKKVKRMQRSQDPGLAAFLEAMRPRAQAYLDLRSALYPPA